MQSVLHDIQDSKHSECDVRCQGWVGHTLYYTFRVLLNLETPVVNSEFKDTVMMNQIMAETKLSIHYIYTNIIHNLLYTTFYFVYYQSIMHYRNSVVGIIRGWSILKSARLKMENTFEALTQDETLNNAWQITSALFTWLKSNNTLGNLMNMTLF